MKKPRGREHRALRPLPPRELPRAKGGVMDPPEVPPNAIDPVEVPPN